MNKSLRQPTLQTLGLGSVLDIFRNGRLPANAGDLVDRVFGPAGERGSLVITGACGVVGAGKAMQLGARLEPFGVRVVALDFPDAPDGLARQQEGLVRAFGEEGARRIMANIVRLTYDGKSLPAELADLRPRYLLEAIPEVLDLKRAHYEMFRAAFPDIEIKSVTSGFPSSELGVGIAHPAFPHEINKVWEMVEPEPSAITQLHWALGLMPIPVSDHWSFVLDVLFCGLTLAGTRYHEAAGMPFRTIDKYVRRQLGPNPYRAHDAIGAKGANFLTWSCVHHLSQHYGALFEPTQTLERHKETGGNWSGPKPATPDAEPRIEPGDAEADFQAWILGPLAQMTGLMLHEQRAHLSHMNAIGELCAQFRRGILAVLRELGAERATQLVGAYHERHPEAARAAWHPEVFGQIQSPAWQQLYVNAEHDGTVGVITLSREAYNRDVDAELNRAIDWLRDEDIERVILTGDFHLSTQMVGADTSEFFPALDDETEGARVAGSWSRTARRLHDEFAVSVAFAGGKRCLGGMLELLLHCHYLVATKGTSLGLPEVTLPVVPGMEGCHWPFRKTTPENWPNLLQLMLTGRPVRAEQSIGWLADAAGPLPDMLQLTWQIARGESGSPARRNFETGPLQLPADVPRLPEPKDAATETARKAILASIRATCAAPLSEALELQTRHSAAFMTTETCKKGRVGQERSRM